MKKVFALVKAFVFRYRSFNKKSVKDFAEKFNRLKFERIKGKTTLKKIVKLVSSLVEQGLTNISIKSYSLIEYDKSIRGYKPLIKDPEMFTYLMGLGQLYMRLTEETKDHTEESIMVLKFFGYIRFNKKKCNEKDLLDAYERYKYVRDIKKGNVLTDIPEDRFNAAFIRTSKSIKNISIITNKDSFVNKFGNELYSYQISVSNDRHLNIFLPICENGFYNIGTNIIHLRKYKQGDYLFAQLRRELNNISNLAFAYPDLQAKVLEELFQRNIINVFFEKSIIKPTKREVDEALRFVGVNRNQLTDLLTREVVNTIIGHRSMPASKAKNSITLLELQMDKGIISESPISTAIKLIKGRGRNGFSYYPHFPLTNELVKDYDFSIGKTAGETIYRYLDENKKIPWALYTGINALYDRKAKRTHLMANQQIKAFKMRKVDKPITVFASLPENVELDIPVSNSFTVFDSKINEGGKTTSADVNLVSPEVARLYGIKNNHKSVFDGLGKNTNRILKNNYYFYLNGKKHYVIFSNAASIHSRENFGILIAGLYNMKKFEDGNVKDTEVRDVLANPIREDELAGMKDIYYEVNGVEKFYARRFVGLNSQYFVDKAQSGFDEIILGDEVRNRLVLMRANNLITELYGDFNSSLLRAQKAERDFPGNAYGKGGMATREFYASANGFYTTATLNLDLADDEIRININSRDFAKFVKMFECVRTRSEYWDLFQKGKLTMRGLKLRFPHMDDAGLMYVNAIFNFIEDDDPFYETAYIETNVRSWIRMGGDADGDQIFFIPLSKEASSEAKKLLSYENFKQVSNIQDTDWVLSNGVDENYTDLQGLLDFIAKVKRRDLNAKSNKVADILKPMSMTELKSKLGVSLFTTRASKDMIGKAKAPTMKMLGQFTTQFIRGESIGNSYADETLKDIRETANDLNNYYGQNAIDIDKWGDNIRAVWETILEIEFLNILMTLLLDPNVLVTNSFIPQVKNLIPMRYHKIKDSNLEETIEKLEAEIRNHTIDPKKDIFKYIDYELLKFMINHSTSLKRLYEPEILDGYPTGFMIIKRTDMNPTITDKKMNDILNIVKTKVTKLAKDLTETVLADYSDDLIFTYKDEESE